MQSQTTIADDIEIQKTPYHFKVAKDHNKKILNYEKAPKETDAMKEALKSLYEYGFSDYKANKIHLLKCKNVDTVKDVLVEALRNGDRKMRI